MLGASPSALTQTRERGGTGELLDGVAALVNEGAVLRSQLTLGVDNAMKNFERFQAQIPPQQRRPPPPLSVLQEQVLEALILHEIQIQRARLIGITVGDDQLNQLLAAGAESNGITLEQMPATLAAEGINYAAFREETREQMMLDQLSQREVVATISVAPREMEL